MAPAQAKSVFTEAMLHYTSCPSALTLAVCGPTTVCYVTGKHLCFYNTASETREFAALPEGVYTAKSIAANIPAGLVAIVTSGPKPCIYLFGIESKRLKFIIPEVAELDVPDMQFSHCGSRLFVIAKGQVANTFQVYTTTDGSILPGCEQILPAVPCTQIFPHPSNKDVLFLCNGSRCFAQLVTITRSFLKYIVSLRENGEKEKALSS